LEPLNVSEMVEATNFTSGVQLAHNKYYAK